MEFGNGTVTAAFWQNEKNRVHVAGNGSPNCSVPKFSSVRIGGCDVMGSVVTPGAGRINETPDVFAQLLIAELRTKGSPLTDTGETSGKSGPSTELSGAANRPATNGCAETVNTDPIGVAAVGLATANSGTHCDPLTLSGNEDGAEAFRFPPKLFVVPFWMAGFSSVNSGPNLRPLNEPSETGSYCIKNAELACEKSTFPEICAPN